MPKLNYEKKIGNKLVKILVQSGNKQGELETWGVSMLCPWCGSKIMSTGYATPKKAATWFFRDLELHYKRRH